MTPFKAIKYRLSKGLPVEINGIKIILTSSLFSTESDGLHLIDANIHDIERGLHTSKAYGFEKLYIDSFESDNVLVFDRNRKVR